LAEFLFDDETNLVRLDMSEYAEKHSTARMIGSPPGYVGHEEGGALTEAVRRKPHAVVLFDEVEKAHPDVFDVLLQLLDDGRLTDGQGRTVDFSQTLVLMTSNLRHEDQVRQYFRPEFINRLDEVLVFEALKPEQLNAIAQVQVQRIRTHLAEQEIGLEVSEAALTELAKLGWSEEYGARPLKRAIQKHVQNVLADAILAGRIQRGHTAKVDVSDGRFWVAPKKAEVTATAAV
jgi:ATP-dependent Clp protease ATP-binding subunit ClpB